MANNEHNHRGSLRHFADIKYETVQTIKEFEDAEKFLAEWRYPSRFAEKNRVVRSKKRIVISKDNLDKAWEDISSMYLKRLQKKLEYKDVTEGQYIKYDSLDTLAKIVKIDHNEELAIKYIITDSEYVWNIMVTKSIFKPGKRVFKLLMTAKLPIAVEYVSWRSLIGRTSYVKDAKQEMGKVKDFIEERWLD